MNGFLVAVRCDHDDVPLGLFATREEAAEFARRGTLALVNDTCAKFKPAAFGSGDDAYYIVVIEFIGGRPTGDMAEFDLQGVPS
jgi:hypothetical protein